MIMKNRYFIRSRISESKFRTILRYFSVDLTATQISSLTGLNINTINSILMKLRKKIADFCEKESIFSKGEIEIDESFFGARRVRGLRGRGAKGKTIVFGLKKRNGKVYTQVIKNCSQSVILPLINKKIPKTATLYTDGFKSYDSLVDVGYKKHYRVFHGKNEFAKTDQGVKNHINGIENFWGIAKVRLSKFRGLSKETFYLHLKECEFRFNYKSKVYLILLKMLRDSPLK